MALRVGDWRGAAMSVGRGDLGLVRHAHAYASTRPRRQPCVLIVLPKAVPPSHGPRAHPRICPSCDEAAVAQIEGRPLSPIAMLFLEGDGEHSAVADLTA